MPRYVAVDNGSGFTFGEVLADDPVSACRLVDRLSGVKPNSRLYNGPLPWECSTSDGYFMYALPAGHPKVASAKTKAAADQVAAVAFYVGFVRYMDSKRS